jgi:hypothetical protein
MIGQFLELETNGNQTMGAGIEFQLAKATSTKIFLLFFFFVYNESVFKVLVIIYIFNVCMILKVC